MQVWRRSIICILKTGFDAAVDRVNHMLQQRINFVCVIMCARIGAGPGGGDQNEVERGDQHDELPAMSPGMRDDESREIAHPPAVPIVPACSVW